MPKNKISEYSVTPSENTDIGGIDIAEGCAPSGINNAIRTLMSDLKDWQAGTSSDTLPIAAGGTGAATAAAARTALGATTTGNSLFTSATAAAARTTLGATTTGDALFISVDAAAARTAIGAGAGDVTTTGTQTLTNKTISGADNTVTVDGTVAVGFRTIPQNSQSTAYTLVLADSGKHILHPSADTTARTFTIPANSSVAYPVGTAITFINQNSAGVVTIAITTDTMRLALSGTTGSRTLAANGVATAIKITSTEWIISGTGLT